MAINYSYNAVVDGVTDANAAYMNNMQTGIKAACDVVDTLAYISSDITSDYLTGATVQKYRGIVQLKLGSTSQALTSGASIVIATLPADYKPKVAYASTIVLTNGVVIYIYISASTGTITIKPYGSVSSNVVLFSNLTYLGN